jgi:2-polyprenyl-3-methyl-5-hydroxy-6-metoxy-1,4-benzoquinol methylase
MSAFKDDLYRDYVATHLLPRKSAPTIQAFEAEGRTWRRQFAGWLPADTRVPILDVGCGWGKVVWWLQHEGYAAAEGVDVNAEVIEIGQRLGVQRLHHADAHAWLAARPNHYALIVMRDVLEHFRRDEVMRLLALVHASLSPGGRVIIQAPNGESPFFGRIRYGDFTHELAFAPSSMQQVLRATGFAEVDVRASPPVPRGPRSWPRMLAWFIVERFYRFLLWAECGRRRAIVTQNLLASARRPADGPDVAQAFRPADGSENQT